MLYSYVNRINSIVKRFLLNGKMKKKDRIQQTADGSQNKGEVFGLPSSVFRLPTSDFCLPTSVFRLPSAVFCLLSPVSLFLLVSFVLSISVVSAFGQKTNFHIAPEVLYLDGLDTIYKNIEPGDTLSFTGGNRDYLLIKNFLGAEGKPIVMINSDGDVIIDTDHYFGISIENCRYIRLTGTGDPEQKYGFQIKRVAYGSGMGIGYSSSDFEIDHISIENCPIGGIYAKTDPDCSLTTVRDAFTQYNTVIHDNYIANAGNEGLYIGSSKYSGQEVNCNGKDTLLLPSLLEGVKVYNNIIKYSGWDGIQVSSASKNCSIYNNTVMYDSQAENQNQMSGIIMGGGSKCDCYNNFIAEGKGDGIESHGLGGYKIFNNIIVDAGRSFLPSDLTQMKHGIFVSDVSIQNDSSFNILHNDIINPKSDGIRFSSVLSKNNVISSNVIINPGNYDYYENGNTSFKGSDSYIMFQNSASDVILLNNYLARNANLAGFKSLNMQLPDDFKLIAGSPLIDAADSENTIPFDFSGFPRPIGSGSDIGSFEYDPTSSANQSIISPEAPYRIQENPVSDFLKIYSENPIDQKLELNIYNSSGQKIRKFITNDLVIGNQIIQADVSELSSGIYFYSVRNGNTSATGKIVKR